jgi:alkanesulfonate monooxygenase SsuD/methylene tetrahydromethanopterin reductase-like flavin-dependent oxidoreductase (luciferase family)
VAAGVFAADTDEEAVYHRSSQLLAFARLRMGNPGKLPLPVKDVSAEIPAPVLVQVEHALSCSATGSPATIRDQLSAIITRYQPDELMITGMIHDHGARVKSFQLAADVLKDLVTA